MQTAKLQSAFMNVSIVQHQVIIQNTGQWPDLFSIVRKIM